MNLSQRASQWQRIDSIGSNGLVSDEINNMTACVTATTEEFFVVLPPIAVVALPSTRWYHS